MTFNTAKTALFTLFITFISFTQLFAQGNGSVTGTLNDAATNEPLGFATVAVLPKGSTVPLMSKQTDINGKFSLTGIKDGAYTLRATYVGYLTVNTDFTISAAKREVILNSVKLSAAKGVLKQVEVSAQKSEIKLGIDKKSFDVSQSLVSQGGSATDLLANVPSVQVDVDGNISLRGSNSVKILINGKPSTLTGSNLTDILQSIPASSIETIEVITNPSSKYDAEGQSGLINIVLKKNVAMGLTGSASATVGTQKTYNGTVNLAYQTSKINIYGNYSYRQANRIGDGSITKNIQEPGLVAYTDQASNQEFDFKGHNIRTGIDVNLNDKNTLSFSDNINIRNRDIFQTGITNTTHNGAFYDSQNQNNTNDGSGTNLDFNLDFDHKFKKKGEEWTFNVGYSRDKNNSVANLFTDTTNATHATFPPIASIATTNGLEQNWNLQTDYTLPLKDGRFETGYRGTFNSNDVNYITDSYTSFTTPPSYLYNALLSDDFFYKLNIQAVYANYQHQFGKFGVQGGVRMEDTHVNTQLTTNGTFTPNRQYYTRLYPTLFLTEKLTDNETIQLSYSRRVARPQERQLSPFLDQSNTQNYQQGNPNLLPEDTHSFELSYINYWSGVTLTSSLYYRLTHDAIQQIVTPFTPGNLTTNLSTFENIASASNAGYELIAKISPSNIVDLTLNANAYYREIGADPTYGVQSSSGFSWNANLTGSIKATKKLSVQLRGDYQGAQVSAQGKNLAMYGLDGGVKYDLSKLVSLSVNSRDIFNTRKFRSETHLGNTPGSTFVEDQYSDRRFGTRTVMFTLTYRLGSSPQTPKKGQKGPADNQDNLGGDDMGNGQPGNKDNGAGGTIGQQQPGKGTTPPPAKPKE
jgi:outer membrane receptor protein involved in Fe transport